VKTSSLLDPRKGLHLYPKLVKTVGQQHRLSKAGLMDLESRVAQALVDQQLLSRDPESGLPITTRGRETPLVSLDDFNGWLAANHSSHLKICGVTIPTTRIPRVGLTTIAKQDRALEIYGELGYSPPASSRERWTGVTKLAQEIGWGSRQHWQKMLVAAIERKRPKSGAWSNPYHQGS
jgi:hypothetical protein